MCLSLMRGYVVMVVRRWPERQTGNVHRQWCPLCVPRLVCTSFVRFSPSPQSGGGDRRRTVPVKLLKQVGQESRERRLAVSLTGAIGIHGFCAVSVTRIEGNRAQLGLDGAITTGRSKVSVGSHPAAELQRSGSRSSCLWWRPLFSLPVSVRGQSTVQTARGGHWIARVRPSD